MKRGTRILIASLCLAAAVGAYSLWHKGPFDRELRALYPAAERELTSPIGYAGTPGVSWLAPIGGRYVLMAQKKCGPCGAGAAFGDFPEVYIVEVKSVEGNTVSYNEGVRVTETDWRRLVDAKGDITVILGHPPNPAPVPEFDWAWHH
jgi:hypothetical protein